MPPGYVDVGTLDDFFEALMLPELEQALNENGHSHIKINYHEGYDHGYFFITDMIEDHVDFHADHLYR